MNFTVVKKEIAEIDNQTQQWTSGQNLSARIDFISFFGLVDIKFNASTDIVSGFNYTWFNSSFVDCYIEPANNRHKFSDNFNLTDLNFTWEPVDYQSGKLQIQLYFYNYSAISLLPDQDTLVVHFKNETVRNMFYSMPLKKYLHPEFWTLKSDLKK